MIFNMIGGSGGGGGLSESDAVLRVPTVTGATVTATKNGVTLSPKLWAQNTYANYTTAIFTISSGMFDSNAWTVTATLNGVSATSTVVIDAAKEYDVILLINRYYIVSGDIQPDIIPSALSTRYSGSSSVTIDTSNPFKFSTVAGYGIYLSPFDVSEFSSLVVDLSVSASSFSWAYFGMSTDTKWYDNTASSMGAYQKITSAISRSTYTLDVSGLSGTYYFKYYTYATATTTIYNLRLER